MGKRLNGIAKRLTKGTQRLKTTLERCILMAKVFPRILSLPPNGFRKRLKMEMLMHSVISDKRMPTAKVFQ